MLICINHNNIINKPFSAKKRLQQYSLHVSDIHAKFRGDRPLRAPRSERGVKLTPPPPPPVKTGPETPHLAVLGGGGEYSQLCLSRICISERSFPVLSSLFLTPYNSNFLVKTISSVPNRFDLGRVDCMCVNLYRPFGEFCGRCVCISLLKRLFNFLYQITPFSNFKYNETLKPQICQHT